MTHMKTAARRLAAALILTALLAMQAFAAVPAYLIPGGNTVGIKLYTQGLMIVKIADGTAAQAAFISECGETKSAGSSRPGLSVLPGAAH